MIWLAVVPAITLVGGLMLVLLTCVFIVVRTGSTEGLRDLAVVLRAWRPPRR